MAGPNSPYTNLDSSQVIRRVFDETTDELRVKATFTPGSSEIIISDVDDSIKIGKGDGTTFLNVNPDGSINVVGTFNAPIGAATEAKQDDQIVILDNIDTNTASTAVNTASIDTKLTTTNSTLSSLDTKATTTNTTLSAIDIQLTTTNSSLSSLDTKATTTNTTLSAIETAINALPQDNNGLISGTEDGTLLGTPRVFINNIRVQILATQDRQQDIVYADFGTKNQRITQIDYYSATLPGFIARKTLTYTPVGSKYRRDSIDWSIV